MFCCCLCMSDEEEISGDEDKVSSEIFDTKNMVTVVKTYNIRDNIYYKTLIDSVQADDD